jgi:hypothetical protein
MMGKLREIIVKLENEIYGNDKNKNGGASEDEGNQKCTDSEQ